MAKWMLTGYSSNEICHTIPVNIMQSLRSLLLEIFQLSFLDKSLHTPYNGSRLNEKATSGLEGRVPQLLSELQKAFWFGYFPGYFRQFFLTVDTRRWTQKEWDHWYVGEHNLSILPWFLMCSAIYQPFQDAFYTIPRQSNASVWICNISVSCQFEM